MDISKDIKIHQPGPEDRGVSKYSQTLNHLVGPNPDIFKVHIWSGLTEKDGLPLRKKSVIAVASTKDVTVPVRGP